MCIKHPDSKRLLATGGVRDRPLIRRCRRSRVSRRLSRWMKAHVANMAAESRFLSEADQRQPDAAEAAADPNPDALTTKA